MTRAEHLAWALGEGGKIAVHMEVFGDLLFVRASVVAAAHLGDYEGDVEDIVGIDETASIDFLERSIVDANFFAVVWNKPDLIGSEFGCSFGIAKVVEIFSSKNNFFNHANSLPFRRAA